MSGFDDAAMLRVFVVGVPRSGTTLVQSLLASHSAVTSFTESHFFDEHFALVPWLGPVLKKHPGVRLRAFLAENGEPAPESALWFDQGIPFPPFVTSAAARRLLALLDELARRRGKRCWIEKTPRHLRYVPFLERLSGEATPTRFVHVIRHGLDVVASLREASRHWTHPYDLETCARRWNADLELSLRRVGSPNDRFVFYEELTARPAGVLKELFAGLGLAWEPDVLDLYGTAAATLVRGEEPWKEGVGRGIERSRAAAASLSPDERTRVRGLLGEGLYDELRERAGAHV